MNPKNQKEIARIKLKDTSVGNEKQDLRVFVSTDNYTGPTKRGVRFYLFDGIWPEFKKLIGKVDKEVKELG